MRWPLLTAFASLALPVGVRADGPSAAAPPAPANPLDAAFGRTVQPFVQTYCASCHGSEKPKGDLDLSPYTSVAAVTGDPKRWELVLERLKAGDMPPAKAKHQPSADERRAVVDWIEGVREREAARTAGDPGPVLSRRLSNAEYDYSVRELTGQDIRPTAEFPVDPANEAGFDNTGESLTMSPALMKKYLEGARHVAEHLVFKPDGLAFAPHPMVADTDRDKYAVRQVVDFYRRQPTDLADYFEAAWRFKHRSALGKPDVTLADVAVAAKVSPKYLATVWHALADEAGEVGPTAAARVLWNELPSPTSGPTPRAGDEPEGLRAGCVRMRDFVVAVRQQLVPEVKNLTAPSLHPGSQPLVLWKDRAMAANRRRYVGGIVDLKPTGLTPGSPAAAAAMVAPKGSTASQAGVDRYAAALAGFCDVFPDAFFVSERARVYLDAKDEAKLTGRLLSAGFHSQMGYFRDDAPLYDLVLDEGGRRELDRLWQELDFIADVPLRQHQGMLWFDRTDSRFMRDAEFDPYRPEDKDAGSEAKVAQVGELYVAKVKRNGASDAAVAAVADHFKRVNENLRRVERLRAEAEPKHLAALTDFVAKAYRRPLSAAERDDLVAFYRSLRDQDGLGHEDAVRDTVVMVLMSPNFCYRVSEPREGGKPATVGGVAVRPLSDRSLAERLSYFLWSSAPDAELLAAAARDELHRPAELAAQARRMLKDPRARGLATEFAANWLDVRRFEEHNSVDRGRFPAFTNDLRQAMFEEPVRFFQDVVANDRSIFDFLYGDHTFVNGVLAKHYGMPEPTAVGGKSAVGSDGWVRVEGAGQYGRGGLLPMAAFLTKNSPGLRTSPVKRGYWVVRRLLGEHIPAPPADVPELPSDEAKLGERTLREALAVHRENKSCAVCHDRFDAIGLVFEGYGPVGDVRAKDFGGRSVETSATFPGGSQGDGLAGLRTYIRQSRQQDFVDNLCRKLLAYGLGRTLLPSDDQTVAAMRDRLAASDYHFGSLVESIVTSPQFLNMRDPTAKVADAKETSGDGR